MLCLAALLLVPTIAHADGKSDALVSLGRAFVAVEEAETLEARWNHAVECNGAVAMAVQAEANGGDQVPVAAEGKPLRTVGFNVVVDACQRAERDAASRLARK